MFFVDTKYQTAIKPSRIMVQFQSRCRAGFAAENSHFERCKYHTLCPMNLKALSCGLKFHNMTVLSPDPDASCFKDGLKATEVT